MILISGLAVAGGVYFGLQLLSSVMIGKAHFSPVSPGRVNFVGITPGAGYQIILANDVAQLVQTEGGFQGDSGQGASGPTEGAIKKRMPVRELLAVLRGDGKFLGPFVMKMNNLDEKEDWSPTRVPWTKDEIEKAIGGDPKLRAKLEHDLNVRLDGTPIVPLSRNALENGIFVHAPIELTVSINGVPTVVRGETVEPYKPNILKAVESRYADKAEITNEMIGGYYAEEVRNVAEKPSTKENVAQSLRAMYSKETMDKRLEAPRRLLQNTNVVLNEGFVEDASYRSYKTNDGHTLSDLTIDLNDEGRRRLWKFSRDRVGGQILLIADDVAIAAPRIEHELALSEFTIRQMPDQVLVDEAVKSIKASKGK